MKHYRAVFYEDDHKNELLQINDVDEQAIITRSMLILEDDYHDAHCVIEDCDTEVEVLTLKRCGIE